MRPSRYFAVSSWSLIALAWGAILSADVGSEVIGGMAILTFVACVATVLTWKKG